MSKPFLYRPPHGIFSEAMAQVRAFANGYALMAYLNKTYGTQVMLSELTCERVTFDHRNGWETYSLSLPGVGLVGYTNAPVHTG